MRLPRWLFSFACLALMAGCSSAPSPESTPPPAAPIVTPDAASGASETDDSIPGSASAMYTYRFKLTEPANNLFTFRDRDLTFYFRPTASALHFKIENLQGRPISINWDHCTFTDVNGRTGKVAHNTSLWRDRYSTQAPSVVAGLQTYSDYVFPIEYLLDPGVGGIEQPHQPIAPEDASAPTYSGRTFGVDFELLVEDRPRVYPFRFVIDRANPR